MSGITCGNCKAKHDTVAQVRACYGQAVGTVQTLERPVVDNVRVVDYPATDKQVAFITRLSSERWYSEPGMTRASQPALGVIEDIAAGKPVTKRDASNTITYLQGCAKRQFVEAVRAAETTPVAVGMYRIGERLFRVYEARSADKHLLAKELINEPYADEAGHRVDHWSFIYAGTPRSAGIKPEHRMSLEEAQAFGRQYGFCCVCARFLTDPESVFKGIGPVCEGRV